jgi:ATP-binding cassette subfamily C protein
MIAASIMMGRALAPIETAIANWRGFIAARESIKRLSAVLARIGTRGETTELPPPVRSFDVDNLTVAAPGGQTALAKDVTFHLAAGQALGVIGPSGAGKTSLVRALVGVWPPACGSVRIDGAELCHWDPTALGRHVGFVSQGVELFDGTIAENISRMEASPNSEAVLEAARQAGAHDMIQLLPSGYDTAIGEGGAALSAGQRQRVALARALYGNPFLLVLDEPNSNLDSVGEAALQKAIQGAKARGAIIILIAHRTSALALCDMVLVLVNGAQQACGPRDEILRKNQASAAAVARVGSGANLKVVRDIQARSDR